MNISFDIIEDKVEFFEETSLKELEKKINTQIEVNKTILIHIS